MRLDQSGLGRYRMGKTLCRFLVPSERAEGPAQMGERHAVAGPQP